MVAYTYARSVVDHDKVSDDELNDAIEQSMGGQASADAVAAYKDKLIALWKKTIGKDPIKVAAAHAAEVAKFAR